ncbi:hypothetical protein WJX79_008013 [Trebouxia sp. C0005]
MGKGAERAPVELMPPHMLALKQHRAHNFSAGAAMFDTNVMAHLQNNFLSYDGSGMGLFEMSQRDPGGPVQSCIARAEANLRMLLDIPDNYKVLFFQGGAHAQFAAIPMNLFGENAKADYAGQGVWNLKAAAEARKFGEVHMPAGSIANGEGAYPPVEEWGLSDDAAYVHICGNETMSGMTFHTEPEVGPSRVLVADMTSSLLSRPVDVSKYGVIYASSGKNLGPAGNCVVIVRDDLTGNELPQTPSILSWQVQADSGNIYNTPNIFSIWALECITADLLAKGGLVTAGDRARRRAELVYDLIDRSCGFYTNNVQAEYRSHTALPFRIHGGDKQLEDLFVTESTAAGLLQLFGHPLLGGLRVCIYNGLPDEAISELLVFMNSFMQKYQG